jgi:hypothetical protein
MHYMAPHKSLSVASADLVGSFTRLAEYLKYDGGVVQRYLDYLARCVDALPLRALVVGESPYKQDYFPEHPAAFAFKRSKVLTPSFGIPVSVDVLAFDMSYHTKCEFDTAVDMFENSWKHVDSGVLFINSYVSVGSDDCRKYRESALQCDVMRDLVCMSYVLGTRHISLYAFGSDAANFCESLSSAVGHYSGLKMQQLVSNHPAHASRRLPKYGMRACEKTLLNNTSITSHIYWTISNVVDGPHKMPPRASRVEVEARATELAEVSEQIAAVCAKLSLNGGEISKGLREVLETDVKPKLNDQASEDDALNAARVVLIGGVSKIADQLDALFAGLAEASAFIRGISDVNRADTVVKSSNMSGEMFELRGVDDPVDQSEIVQASIVVPAAAKSQFKGSGSKGVAKSAPAEVLTFESGVKLGFPITVQDLRVMRSILMDLDKNDSEYYDEDATTRVCDTIAKFIEVSKITVEEYNTRSVKYPLMYLGNMFNGKWTSDVSPECRKDLSILVAELKTDTSSWKKEYGRVKQVIKSMASSTA